MDSAAKDKDVPDEIDFCGWGGKRMWTCLTVSPRTPPIREMRPKTLVEKRRENKRQVEEDKSTPEEIMAIVGDD